MKAESFIGWDVGGAHLKMAHVDMTGKIIAAHQFPTPIWQGLDKLHSALTTATQYFPADNTKHAVTTTAELSDIFKDRRTGMDALATRMSTSLNNQHLQFYAGSAGWIEADRTGQYVNEIASANWHATASFIAERISTGILVDIGSTTTDIIPFTEGKLLNRGYTDYKRLSCQELVYTGIVRTPVMAITEDVRFNGILRPVVAEHFATMADVYRLTGKLQEQDDMMTTADGAGKSLMDSTRRLARMFAVDIDEHEDTDMWINAAHSIADIQFEKIRRAFDHVRLNMPAIKNPVVVGAGAGRFLANKLAQTSGYSYMDFAEFLDASVEIKPNAARSATAVAVAQLARSAA
jgi:probable H4MPT-linked C1 transfer pathway protein